MEGYVLHEGACVEQCPAAFYKESETCQSEFFLSITSNHCCQHVSLLVSNLWTSCIQKSRFTFRSLAALQYTHAIELWFLWGITAQCRKQLKAVLRWTLYIWLLGCDQHCLQCHRPDECSLCEAPFFLLDVHCVHKCGKRYYADHAQQKCTGKQSERDVVERNQGCSLCSIHCFFSARLGWRGKAWMLC